MLLPYTDGLVLKLISIFLFLSFIYFLHLFYFTSHFYYITGLKILFLRFKYRIARINGGEQDIVKLHAL